MPPTKMGRPPSENPKYKILRIRVDGNTLNKINECSQKLELNMSEVVRKGIDMVHDTLKK